MQFSVIFSGTFIILPILGDPGAGLSEWDNFSFRPAPGSPGIITVRTLPTDTAQLPGYGTVHFCCTASTLVMFNTPVFFP